MVIIPAAAAQKYFLGSVHHLSLAFFFQFSSLFKPHLLSCAAPSPRPDARSPAPATTPAAAPVPIFAVPIANVLAVPAAVPAVVAAVLAALFTNNFLPHLSILPITPILMESKAAITANLARLLKTPVNFSNVLAAPSPKVFSILLYAQSYTLAPTLTISINPTNKFLANPPTQLRIDANPLNKPTNFLK